MFWSGLAATAFIAVILALIGGILVQVLKDTYPDFRWIGYLAIGLGVLALLSTPFTLAARYESSGTVSGYETSDPNASPDTQCGIHKYKAVGESLTGINLFSFSTVTDWCWDGSGITREAYFWTGADTIPLFWEYKGVLNSNEGGDEWHHSDYAQAGFSFCLPVVGCSQHEYPAITKRQYGDGSVSGAIIPP